MKERSQSLRGRAVLGGLTAEGRGSTGRARLSGLEEDAPV